MVADNDEPTDIPEDEYELDTPVEDVSELPLEVIIQQGMVTEVRYRGEPVRALVRDYDVAFPCAAANLQVDEAGEWYFEMIV